MLHLPRKSLENLDPSLLKIIYACVGAHLLLLFFACFVQCDDALHINLAITPGARIVCVPSFMTSSVIPSKKSPRINKRQQRVASSKKLKQPIQKPIKKNHKKNKNKTDAVPAKTTSLKEIEKKQPEAQKIIEPETPALPEKQEEEQTPADDVIYVNKDTYQMFEIAQQLQETISEHWSPPAGMALGLVCQIRVSVDAQGKAIALEVVEKSGVAVFDMAARTALLASTYPPSVWNKTIVVDFNEEFL